MEGLELDEVDLVRQQERAREVDAEDEAPAQRHDEHEVAPFVVARDRSAELAGTGEQLSRREVGLARAHDAMSTRRRAASLSTSRL